MTTERHEYVDMDDILERIAVRLSGHDHDLYCPHTTAGACDCQPGVRPEVLADTIRDVLIICDDLSASAAASIRLVVAARLGIVDVTDAVRQMAALTADSRPGG